MPFTVIFDFAEHFDLPIRRPATEWQGACRVGLLVLLRSSLQGWFAGKLRVFIAVLISFGLR